MTTPTEQANRSFEAHFGVAPTVIKKAPGRVNLIGEHTDYNDGFVFPAAINFHTAVAAAPRDDRIINVVAHDEGNQRVEFNIDDAAQFDQEATWSNYVRGVVDELKVAGFGLKGANLAISGNVPLGAGLSSSAALEMAVISALITLSGEEIAAADAAKIGQAAENNFVGCNCGIMDQMISATGIAGHALLLDCRDLSLQPTPLPKDLAIVVINSNLRRALVDGEYNDRRAQCEQAARHFDIPALRDLTLERLVAAKAQLDPVVFRRARHVVTENQRTMAMSDALSSSDMQTISRLMAESHQSMRDDFEITTPEIDALVKIVKTTVGENGGVRMTGGGFGGCIVALMPSAEVSHALAAVKSDYPEIAGRAASAYICQAADGAFAGY